MAIDPKKKAAVMLDLAGGKSVRAVAKDHGVAQATVSKWSKELQGETGQTSIEVKRNAYHVAQEEFGVSTMKMLSAQNALLSDPAYLRTVKTADIIAHTKFLAGYLIGFVRFQATLDGKLPPPSPEDGKQPIEAYIVEE